MLKDIKRMTAELADKMPAKHIKVAGLLFRYKCAASSAPLYAPLMQLIYTAKSFSYEVKNLKDAANYENDWKIHIYILPSMNNESLINFAATYLKKKGAKVLNEQLYAH